MWESNGGSNASCTHIPYDTVLKVVGDLTKRQGHPPTIGKIISEITVSFWPKLFARGYNAFWWDAPHRLLAQVLSDHPNVARDTRGRFEERLEYFVALRNRVMHQEAIFDGVRALNRPILPVDILHAQLVETIGWLNRDAQKLVTRLDHFDAVFSSDSRTQIESDLKAEFNIP